jgi:hypothetical protein
MGILNKEKSLDEAEQAKKRKQNATSKKRLARWKFDYIFFKTGRASLNPARGGGGEPLQHRIVGLFGGFTDYSGGFVTACSGGGGFSGGGWILSACRDSPPTRRCC